MFEIDPVATPLKKMGLLQGLKSMYLTLSKLGAAKHRNSTKSAEDVRKPIGRREMRLRTLAWEGAVLLDPYYLMFCKAYLSASDAA